MNNKKGRPLRAAFFDLINYYMKKNIFIPWLLFLTVLFVGCSDSDSPIPDPDPEVPTGEIVEGVNLFPKELKADEEAKIVFKASKSSALYNYAGDVYVHIGTAEGTTWLVVPTEWDKNDPKYKMTKEEDNVWSFTISPDMHTWFGVPKEEPIQKIGIVFRSADGTKKGILEDTFIPVEDTNAFTPGEVVLESQPAGTLEGVNPVDDTTVTFVFYDKDKHGSRKAYAHLIGDFNGWKLDNEYQMKYDSGSGCWWYTLSGLNSETEYAFQYYVVDQSGDVIRLADAYTEKILDPDNDKYITAYPGLREYPSDKTYGIISTFKTKKDQFTWKSQKSTVDKHNLVIYEMLFRDFTASGDIKGAIGKLDYIQSLGVNAIELMPVQEFDGNDSWGYNPCFFFAMDKAYGTQEDYKNFIDECHKRNIAVILDVVYNHATGAHPFAKLYWDAKKNKTATNNPWFNVDAPHPYSVFHDFNHESPLVRTFVKRNLEFLLEEYNIDGFRFDLSKGFTQKKSTEGNMDDFDGTRVAILKDYNATIKAVDPNAIVILEHFAEEKEEKELAEDGMMLWRNLNNAYCETAMGWWKASEKGKTSFVGMSTKDTSMPFGGWVGYMESHDEERAAYKQTAYGNDEYNLKTNLSTRMKQLEVNSALCFTIPGPKMIWQFGELGYDISIEAGGRTGKKPIKWEYLDKPERKQLHDTYSKLISLRTQEYSDLFTSSATTLEWDVENWGTGRYVSLRGITGEGLVAVGNFTNQEIECNVNFQSTGTWSNYISEGETLEVTSETQKVKVPAHSYCIYTKLP